jgi:hypothetical protein
MKDEIIAGMFQESASVENAYNVLRDRGYNTKDVNLVMSESVRKKFDIPQKTPIGEKALSGAGTGAVIGTVIGATAGIITDIGVSIIIPGIGLFLAGQIAAALAGAGAGGITGGIIGALIGAGIPKDTAHSFESDIKSGHILMTVKPQTDMDATFIENEWRKYGGNIVRYLKSHTAS